MPHIVVDGRNLFDLDLVRGTGLDYHSIGRASVEEAA